MYLHQLLYGTTVPPRYSLARHLRRLVRRIRRHWPATHITIRGDGHYGRPQVMAWCEENGIDFVLVCNVTRRRGRGDRR
jgi:hypothetical protein